MTSLLAPGSATGTAAAAATGAMFGLGLTLIAAGLWPSEVNQAARPTWWTTAKARMRALATGDLPGWGDPVVRRAGAVVLAFVAVGLVTRWPIGAVLAGAAAWALPGLWRPDAAARS